MAQIVPYLVGGVTAFLVADVVPLPSPSEQFGALRSSIAAPAPALGTPGSSVNRAVKRDRGAISKVVRPAASIATVEVIGVRDAAIVTRDRDGRELFRTDPLNNVTIVTKNLNLPEVTVRQHNGSVIRPVPVEVIPAQPARDRKPRGPKVPLGCEPSFSVVAAPSLAHHTGRCMARLQAPWKAISQG
jgi:hypothetical protein